MGNVSTFTYRRVQGVDIRPRGPGATQRSIKPGEIRKLVKRKHKGYILEVDIRHPRELHDSHKDLPFMCDRM